MDGRDFGLDGFDDGGDSLLVETGSLSRTSGVDGRDGMFGILISEACTLGSADVTGERAR